MEAAGPRVLILGAGINGCSVARELVLNGVGVWIVEANDIAFGATSRSSRLIHGGLRYLEYGDFRLVRESLAERGRLCRLAAHLVEPLRLYIPVSRRGGGLFQSAGRFLGISRSPLLDRITRPLRRPSERGLWIVRIGLWLYDRLAGGPTAHSVHDSSEANVPQLDRRKYRWLCAYSDAQMRFPERYCVALLDDARQIAADTGVEFRLFTYSRAEFVDDVVRVRSSSGGQAPTQSVGGEAVGPSVAQCAPALIVNATGAWGDRTLQRLDVAAPPLFGGTKGSHFITYQRALKAAIGDAGVYAEADDGRLIFVLPFGAGVLVGTTDERFDDPPERAVASGPELEYLVATVNRLFPQVGLSPIDLTLTYSGVRPLPRAKAGSEGSISRDHSIDVHAHGRIPVLTLVGGKLTTSRAFGELVADDVLRRLGVVRSAFTVARVVPGGENVPADPGAREAQWAETAARFRLDVEQVGGMWSLCGSRVEAILADCQSAAGGLQPGQTVAGTRLPAAFVCWMIQNEWVARLEDLVERRLMVLYEPDLSVRSLDELAGLMIACGRLAPELRRDAVDAARARLVDAYQRNLKE